MLENDLKELENNLREIKKELIEKLSIPEEFISESFKTSTEKKCYSRYLKSRIEHFKLLGTVI